MKLVLMKMGKCLSVFYFLIIRFLLYVIYFFTLRV